MTVNAVYHLLILKFNRNLWYGIFIHTFFDFIGLTMIYLGFCGKQVAATLGPTMFKSSPKVFGEDCWRDRHR